MTAHMQFATRVLRALKARKLKRDKNAARSDGRRDRREGKPPLPWPWDDGGELETAYLEGYSPRRPPC